MTVYFLNPEHNCALQFVAQERILYARSRTFTSLFARFLSRKGEEKMDFTIMRNLYGVNRGRRYSRNNISGLRARDK